MGRTYAGILGTLACLATASRALLGGTAGEATLLDAWWALLTFAAIGAMLGSLAGAVVEEAARKQVEKEWAEPAAPAGAAAAVK
jgi:hypothetical protein